MSSVTALDDACHELLNACLILLALTDGGVPAREYVSPGQPADEGCDQIVVWCADLGKENTSPLSPPPQIGHRQTTGSLNLATLKIRFIRCVETSDPQASILVGNRPAETIGLEASAKLGNEDAWALWCGLMFMVRHQMLFETCSEIHFDSCTAIATEGNMAGWELTMRVKIDAFLPAIGT